jgi:hypothetical protein
VFYLRIALTSYRSYEKFAGLRDFFINIYQINYRIFLLRKILMIFWGCLGQETDSINYKQYRRVEYQYISLVSLIRVLITDVLNTIIGVTVIRGLCAI